ncbi:DUF4296 domain-containing protein [uncultured Allomuricauda sp.]|uniref:DUF4296 domain-containing protein n=1 Tax=Flagellimonas sp. W118 TaxID=3410791 RepID=UPI00261D0433|nr:DUF4296 domain-containing protein [uncultured Allomuricauda sp.]
MKRFIIFFLVLGLFSCNEKVVEEPENLIPKEKMVTILHDLALLNATKSSYKAALELHDIRIMDFLYQQHDIDSAQFAKSDLYYASLPLEYQSIYEKVEALLEKESADLEHIVQKRNDSVRKAQEKKRDSIVDAAGDKTSKP